MLQFLAFRLGEVKADYHKLESALSHSKVRMHQDRQQCATSKACHIDQGRLGIPLIVRSCSFVDLEGTCGP